MLLLQRRNKESGTLQNYCSVRKNDDIDTLASSFQVW